MWICVIDCGSISGRPDGWTSVHLPVLCGQKINIGHCMQTFQSFFSVPAMLVATIDFYHFVPISVTLTVGGGLRVGTKQNLMASFCHTFQLIIRMEFHMVLNQFKLNIWILLLNEI